MESSSEPLKSKFNDILGGKLFVSFEELESFSKNDWICICCVLKRQITSDLIVLTKKGQDPYESDNINNYMLLTNHDTDDNGRRFCVADISTHRKGDEPYWNNIYNNCFNEEVGYALYCFLCEIDTSKFKAQKFPITKNKLNSISKRLDSVYSFLKDDFILKKISLNEKLTTLYDNYKQYCLNKHKNPCAKTDFTTKLSEIQINFYKSNGYNTYKVSLETLNQIANKNHWINDIDEYEKEDENDNISENMKPKYEFGNPHKLNYEKMYNELLIENEKILNLLLEKEKKIIEPKSDIIKSNKVKSKVNNTRILDKEEKCQLTNEDLLLIGSI